MEVPGSVMVENGSNLIIPETCGDLVEWCVVGLTRISLRPVSYNEEMTLRGFLTGRRSLILDFRYNIICSGTPGGTGV